MLTSNKSNNSHVSTKNKYLLRLHDCITNKNYLQSISLKFKNEKMSEENSKSV